MFPPELQKFLAQRRIPQRSFSVILGARHQDADPRIWSGCRARRERSSRRCAAQKRDKFAPPHCIAKRLRTAPTIAHREYDYTRNLRPAKWGFRGQFAQQQPRAVHVRFGSKADVTLLNFDVRFVP